MLELIKDSLRTVYQNIELVLILLLINVFSKYIGFRVGNLLGGRFNIVAGIFLVVFNFYLWSATIAALISCKKNDNWTGKQYLYGGVRNFPFFVIWLLTVLIIFNAISMAISLTATSISLNIIWEIWEPIVLFLGTGIFGYITSFTCVYLMEKHGTLKQALKEQAEYIGNNVSEYLFTGIYIFGVFIVSGIVVSVLTHNARSIEASIVFRQLLMIVSDLIRTTSIVVVMATIIFQVPLPAKNVHQSQPPAE